MRVVVLGDAHLIADDDLSVEEYIRQRRDFHVMPFAAA